jgi:hypothetical protein
MESSDLVAWFDFQWDCRTTRDWEYVDSAQMIRYCWLCDTDVHRCGGCGEPVTHRENVICKECLNR